MPMVAAQNSIGFLFVCYRFHWRRAHYEAREMQFARLCMCKQCNFRRATEL